MTVTLSVRVSRDEYMGLLDLCKKNNVSRQEMLRALIVDALAEESDVRSRKPKRCSGGGETGEGCRPAA
jgi:hypothetical protein